VSVGICCIKKLSYVSSCLRDRIEREGEKEREREKGGEREEERGSDTELLNCHTDYNKLVILYTKTA